MTTQFPSLPALERQVAERQLAAAVQTSIEILQAIDSRYGRLEQVALGDITSDGTAEDIALVFCTRFAAAFGRVMADPDVPLSTADFEQLLTYHRWIDLIFSLSGYRTSDHVVPVLARPVQGTSLTFDGLNFLRFLILRSMNSRIHANLEDYWKVSSVGTALAFLHYVSSRYVFWPRAFDFREQILEWLPGRLGNIRLGDLTLARLPEIYMHCSYAVTPRKHAIKADLIKQVRSACLAHGCREASGDARRPLSSRPTIVVVGENFSIGHAVHRTHSRAVAALRERFRVVGVIYPDPVGTRIADLFDECVPIKAGEFLPRVKHLADAILEWKPDLILYLGIGMVSQVIALSSLRLAPAQCVSFGHAATTMSDVMEYFILPDDFAGAPSTFSEKVLKVPKAAMPFAPLSFTPFERPAGDGTIRVAIPASIMKLNPRLFGALSRIAHEAKSRLEFHFFPLAGTGLPYIELTRAVKAQVPNATVFPELPYEAYMERLSKCDLFLSPFPYGNMNSIIDCFRFSLPGVCLDGAETHAHADAAIFARIGLPHSLAAKTVDEYVAQAVRLIDDSSWRNSCARITAAADLDAAFFKGETALFCDAIAGLISAARQP
jgi:HMW1C N-terminal/HMW1 domain 2